MDGARIEAATASLRVLLLKRSTEKPLSAPRKVFHRPAQMLYQILDPQERLRQNKDACDIVDNGAIDSRLKQLGASAKRNQNRHGQELLHMTAAQGQNSEQ